MSAHPGKAILIAGPTASGKSALAVALAREIGGIVVNADSMQVYRDLEVLTARPPAEDLAAAPHVLYGHVDGAESYSAGRYAAEVVDVLADARRSGRIPIFVGGTGLYFTALTEGLSPIPAIDPAVRERWRAAGAEPGAAAALHRELQNRDPVMALRLAATDTQRIVRALEVFDATGRSLSEWQAMAGTAPLAGWSTVQFVLARPREALLARADQRFVAMMTAGAIDEVAALMARSDVPKDAMVRRALGVGPIARLLAGDLDLDAAVQMGQADTRKYIKRQLTWLNRRMIAWNVVHISESDKDLRLGVRSLKVAIDATPSEA